MTNLKSIARSIKLYAGAVAAAGVLACAHIASASPITLGTASNYGLLTGASDTLKLMGSFNISGNVGVGATTAVTLSGTNNVSGNAYEDSGVSVNYSGTTNVTGTTYTNYSLSSAISAATSASTNAAALTATSGLTDQGGSINLSNSSVTIKALTNLSENVLDISALSLSNSTLTFDDNGHTDAKFIINVTGGFSVTGSSVIKGINGATGADIIFNIEGTGSTVSLTGGSTSSVIGTILAPKRSVNLSGGGTLTGALIAGVNNAGTNYTVQTQGGGYNITSLGFTPRTVNTPEPSSMALLGAGVSALLALRRRSRSKKRS